MKYRPLSILVITLGLAIAGCAIPADAPVSEGGKMREYFWQPDGSKLLYDVYNGLDTPPIEHTVTFTSQGSDTVTAIDEAGGNIGLITSRVESQTIFLTDVRATALFPLPDGAYISKYSSEHFTKHELPLSNFLYFEGGAVAFTGEQVYHSTDRINWTKAASLSAHITATCAVNSSRLYAGSAAGDLFLSEDAGNSWMKVRSQLGGVIRTILANENAIYLAIEGAGVFSLKGSTYTAVGTSLPSKKVTGIAFLPTASGEKLVLASTRDSGLLRTFIGGNEPWRKFESTIDGLDMLGVYSEAADVLVTMANGSFYTSVDTGRNWSRATVNVAGTTEQFSAANVSFGRAALATNTGRVFVSQLLQPSAQSIGSVSAEARAIAQTQDGFVVASEHGLQHFTTSGSSSQVGPYEMLVDTARGEFALLQASTDGALKTGDSWHAGNLYLPQSPVKYVQITARVMEQLDSLKIDNMQFGDVFAVRYSLEDLDSSPFPSTPYWIIYYSRGIGPVMIDKIADENTLTSPLSRAVYKGRK